MMSEIISGVEYREVTIRDRTKLIDRCGNAINPIRRKQKATTHVNADGYLCFGGGIPVHMYVAKAWLDGYFEGAEVNHKDFNRQNNNVDNLEWVTHADNVRYSVKENSDIWNKSKQGIHNGRATFQEEDILKIRQMFDSGMTIASIVRVYNPDLVSVKDYKNIHSTFSNICHRKTWSHI